MMNIMPNSTIVEVLCSLVGIRRLASGGVCVREGGVAGVGGSGEGGGGGGPQLFCQNVDSRGDAGGGG